MRTHALPTTGVIAGQRGRWRQRWQAIRGSCPALGVAVGRTGVRAPGDSSSARPTVIHRARTAEGLTGLYRESCAIVLRHYRRPLTVAVVARALASSPRQVQRAFAEIGGTSFSAYLREVRLRHAAQLLAAQPLTVRQVAYLVGYRQPAHFAKAFRRRYGVAPASHRDRSRAQRRRDEDSTHDHGGQGR